MAGLPFLSNIYSFLDQDTKLALRGVSKSTKRDVERLGAERTSAPYTNKKDYMIATIGWFESYPLLYKLDIQEVLFIMNVCFGIFLNNEPVARSELGVLGEMLDNGGLARNREERIAQAKRFKIECKTNKYIKNLVAKLVFADSFYVYTLGAGLGDRKSACENPTALLYKGAARRTRRFHEQLKQFSGKDWGAADEQRVYIEQSNARMLHDVWTTAVNGRMYAPLTLHSWYTDLSWMLGASHRRVGFSILSAVSADNILRTDGNISWFGMEFGAAFLSGGWRLVKDDKFESGVKFVRTSKPLNISNLIVASKKWELRKTVFGPAAISDKRELLGGRLKGHLVSTLFFQVASNMVKKEEVQCLPDKALDEGMELD